MPDFVLLLAAVDLLPVGLILMFVPPRRPRDWKRGGLLSGLGLAAAAWLLLAAAAPHPRPRVTVVPVSELTRVDGSRVPVIVTDGALVDVRGLPGGAARVPAGESVKRVRYETRRRGVTFRLFDPPRDEFSAAD